jgi:hypothetical protein
MDSETPTTKSSEKEETSSEEVIEKRISNYEKALKKVVIRALDFEIELKLEVIGDFTECTNLCMTVIDTKKDSIADFYFKDVVMKQSDDDIVFSSESGKEQANVFLLVDLMTPDVDTFFEIFGNYDGHIFGLNHQRLLKLTREEFSMLNLEKVPTLYILTCF